MLSYKEYKQLNESLYGAFNLGLKSPQNVGGIVSASSVNGTEAALEAQAEEAIEEAKKMKKKMCGDEEEVSVDSEDEEKDDEVEDEDSEDSEEDSDEDEDSEDEDEDSDEEEDEDKVVEVPKMMKKKAKKEWTEALSDLEEIVSEIADKETFEEAKKGFNFVRDVLNKKAKGKGNKDKEDEKEDKDNKDKEDDKEEGEGLTDAQKKLPKKLQDAILKNKKKKKKNKDDKEEKNCNKCVSEGDKSWWDSVNSMINADPNAKNWDGMFSKVEEIETGIRDEERPV